ncbi:hypothetical protein SIAM614_29021 [Stappia aggregata IAM 12614]|uniref:Uncharacterized protein n=1 Tax=Roseibium aggregatum (strain ATCC 25650 / DSM 13394 / JCM 20685 / NBRC 16684 / NCIMB 2208 / IAM 12614 / B1) TaxID=384765 RepID=A0P124_ROSAI|nr:hypothetical protein [Roseibium aggregatum]EAV41209.1 hypothetical protein SIAM614_29021 [Stappia aggregata IAM 12614] [Roseibium aggregatum IAM 12614]
MKPYRAMIGDAAILVPVGDNDAAVTATRDEIEVHCREKRSSENG